MSAESAWELANQAEWARFQTRSWKLAVIDLDGTLYRGSQVIPGAAMFVEQLRSRGIEPVFATNNSTRLPEDVAEHLRELGISALPAEVRTSAQAAAEYLRRLHPAGTKIACIGMAGLHYSLRAAQLQPVTAADAVVVTQTGAAVMGLDLAVTYADLAWFCQYAIHHQSYVLTNADRRLPAAGSLQPGAGALGAFVDSVVGFAPCVVGKPAPDFVTQILADHGVSPTDSFMVGDSVETDIAAASAAGIYSILVTTGVDGPAAVADGRALTAAPNLVCSSVGSIFG